jgi:hypothetical protein
MTRQKHGATLIWFLQQLTPMQRGLRYQRIVVLLPETPGLLQRTRNHTYRLKLCARVRYAVFVDGECLSEVLVTEFFEGALVGDYAGRGE